MHVRKLAFLGVIVVCLALPQVLALHSAGDGVWTTSVSKRFTTPLATAVWWDYSVLRGIPTGIQERNAQFELIVAANSQVTVTAETFPSVTVGPGNVPGVDTPLCLPVTVPETTLGSPGPVVIHETSCVKDNGYSVQVHYFPWSTDPADPDHVISITTTTPTAPLQWFVDAVPLSYKTAKIPQSAVPVATHWTVWVDPAVAPPLPYDVRYTVTSAVPFYYDFMGYRGCPFFATVAPGVGDQELLGCPTGFI